MKKIIKFLGMLMLSALIFVSCDGLLGGKGGEGDEDKPNKKGESLKMTFSISDAKAIGVVKTSKESGRAAEGNYVSDSFNGNLVKITDSGEVQSVIDVPEGVVLPPVTKIWTGTKEGSKGFYLLFESDPSQDYEVTIEIPVDEDGDGTPDSYEYETETHSYKLGQFLYIREDGSYDDILKADEKTYRYIYAWESEDMIKFDKYGYVYYMAYENTDTTSTAIIYRYSSETSKSIAMTVAAPDMTYTSFDISSDAAWVFVQGNSPAAPGGFFRAIPVSMPTNPINLTYGYVPAGYFYDSVTQSLFLTLGYEYSSTDSKLEAGLYQLKLDENNLYDIANVEKVTRSSPKDLLTKVKEKSIPAENLDIDLYEFTFNEETSKWDLKRTAATLMKDYELDVDVYLNYLLTQLNLYYYKENLKGKTSTADAWKPLTLDDVDFRFDKFADVEGFELLATELKSLKNKEAIEKIFSTPKLHKLFGKLCASERYDRAPNTTVYEYNFLADITYSKGTANLFEKEEPAYFKNLKTYNDSASMRFLFYSGDYYDWAEKFYKADGELDTDKLLATIFGLCNVAGQKEFRLSAFEGMDDYADLVSDKKDKDALLWLTASQNKLKLVYNLCNDEDLLHNSKFLNTTCFLAGSDDSAYKFRENYYVRYDETLLSKFFRNSKGLFGISEDHIIHIMNEEGLVIMQVPDVLSTYSTHWLTEGGDGFVFRHDILDSTKHPTGYQILYYYNVEKDTVHNLFEELPDSNHFEVYSFTASKETVLYSGVQGGGYVTCRVNLNTLSNEILDVAYTLSDIAILN